MNLSHLVRIVCQWRARCTPQVHQLVIRRSGPRRRAGTGLWLSFPVSLASEHAGSGAGSQVAAAAAAAAGVEAAAVKAAAQVQHTRHVAQSRQSWYIRERKAWVGLGDSWGVSVVVWTDGVIVPEALLLQPCHHHPVLPLFPLQLSSRWRYTER